MCSTEGDALETVRILCSVNNDCYKCSIKERYLMTECSEQKWSIHQHLSQMKMWERNEKEKSRHKYYCSLLILKQCHHSRELPPVNEKPSYTKIQTGRKNWVLNSDQDVRSRQFVLQKVMAIWFFFFACLMHTAQALLGRDRRETIHQHHIFWTRIHFMAVCKPLGTWY